MHWNLTGWLGAQLGGSAWLLVAGLMALNHDLPTALSVLMLFAVVNVFGWSMWQRRWNVDPARATQRLLLMLAGASLLAVFVLDHTGIFEAIQSGGRVSAMATYALIVIGFGSLIVFIRHMGSQAG